MDVHAYGPDGLVHFQVPDEVKPPTLREWIDQLDAIADIVMRRNDIPEPCIPICLTPEHRRRLERLMS